MPRHTPYNPGYPFKITSHFGKERLSSDGTKYPHAGVDFGAPIGTGIPAASEGRVVYSNNNPTYGITVIIEHADEWGKKFYTLYAHMKRGTALDYGSQVNAGDRIGEVDHSGRSRGDHLHFEVLSPDGYDSQGPYFHVGKVRKHLNTTGQGPHIGIPGNVGRRNPETFHSYGRDVFAKGHPQFRTYWHQQTSSITGGHARTRNEPLSGNRYSHGGHSGHETLERHGDEVTRVEPDGSPRGSFHSE